MKKRAKLKLCDRMLDIATTLILASSIHLEATGSRNTFYVWLHIGIGTLFLSNILWHLYLHFGSKGWIKWLRKQKSHVTRWLAAFCALTFISAAISMLHWISTNAHSPIGGIHSKIGFIFLLLAIVHTIKRIKFLK